MELLIRFPVRKCFRYSAKPPMKPADILGRCDICGNRNHTMGRDVMMGEVKEIYHPVGPCELIPVRIRKNNWKKRRYEYWWELCQSCFNRGWLPVPYRFEGIVCAEIRHQNRKTDEFLFRGMLYVNSKTLEVKSTEGINLEIYRVLNDFAKFCCPSSRTNNPRPPMINAAF